MFEEYIGKKYGELTITELKSVKKDGTLVFYCSCDCGYKKISCGLDRLESGITTNCGHTKRYENLVGKKFGRLTIIEKTDRKIRNSNVWKCKCDCGNITFARTVDLKTGSKKSCGCIMGEKQHFACKLPIHRVWNTMIERCYNKNRNGYYLYGGRGIKVCDEWLGSNPKGFSNFYEWAIANGYVSEKQENGINKYTLDRIDTDGNYSPKNCRWITNKQQQSNKRADKLFCFNNQNISIKEWLKKYYVKCNDYYRLLRLGLTNEDILNYISNKEQIKINFNNFWLKHSERYKLNKGCLTLFDKYNKTNITKFDVINYI